MYDEICYKKNRLSQVIVKVDFLTPLVGLGANVPAKLANRLAANFPIVEPGMKSVNVTFRLSPVAPAQSTQERGQFYNFFGKDREKYISLTDRFMIIVQHKYDTYEKLSQDFIDAYKAVQEFSPDVMTSRFGLRYINVFEGSEEVKPLGWGDYINPALVATDQHFHGDIYSGHVTRLIHIAEFMYEDIGLRFQFGEPNPDFPAVMRKAQFVLDLDAYAQVTHRPEESFQYMDKAHTRIQEIFESSITDRLRELMNA